MRAVIILNTGAGASRPEGAETIRQRIAASCAAAQLDAEIMVVPGKAIGEAVRQAARAKPDVVVAGGGDGTMNSVICGILGTGIPLGILPLGTLNHLARDLGIPPDLDQAVRLIRHGGIRRIDVGMVNDQPFINNSVIGLYPGLVTDRDRQRDRTGRAKWLAQGIAAVRMLGRFPLLRLGIAVDGKVAAVRRTPCVFIGNNSYSMEMLTFGSRKALDRGHLSVYVVKRKSRLGIAGLLLRMLTGRLDQARDFEIHRLTEVDIVSGRRRLKIALDGEARRMHPPLHYRILPGALPVYAPAAAEGDAG